MVQTLGSIDMIWFQHFFLNGQGSPMERLCLCIVLLTAQELCQIIQYLGCHRLVWRSYRQSFEVELFSFSRERCQIIHPLSDVGTETNYPLANVPCSPKAVLRQTVLTQIQV